MGRVGLNSINLPFSQLLLSFRFTSLGAAEDVVKLLAVVLETCWGVAIVLLLRRALFFVGVLPCGLGVLIRKLLVDETIFGHVVGVRMVRALGVHDLVERVDARTLSRRVIGGCNKFRRLTLAVLMIVTSTSSRSRRILFWLPTGTRLL